jgi:hypothetical protein
MNNHIAVIHSNDRTVKRSYGVSGSNSEKNHTRWGFLMAIQIKFEVAAPGRVAAHEVAQIKPGDPKHRLALE